MDFDATITGDKELDKAIKRLPNSMRNKALRPALREGGQIVRAKVVDNIRGEVSDKASGLFARSIVVKSMKAKGKNLRVVIAIGRAVSKKGVRVGLYGSVFELGKANQQPRPVFRPAIKDSTSQVISEIIFQARNRLADAVNDAKG